MGKVYLEANIAVPIPHVELPFLKRRCGMRAAMEVEVGLNVKSGQSPDPGVVTIVVKEKKEGGD